MMNHDVIAKNKALAESLIAVTYNDGEKPSEEFLSDLEQFILGKISQEEMYRRIIKKNTI